MHELTNNLTQWIIQYGNISLFILLAVGIVGLPIPDETFMVFTGLLIAKGHLSPVASMIAAFTGSICGISLSYLLGRTAGNFLVKKYGAKIGLTAHKIQIVHNWFERIGKWTLFFGYFFPGIRHLTGYVAGITRLEYPRFALFAYCGALIWVTTFLSIGYFFGERWEQWIQAIDRDVWIVICILLGISLLYFLVRRWRHSSRS